MKDIKIIWSTTVISNKNSQKYGMLEENPGCKFWLKAPKNEEVGGAKDAPDECYRMINLPKLHHKSCIT